jgi:two-component system response regulator BaeR
MNHPCRIFSRQQIMEKIYHEERFVSDRTVDSHIKKLRRKIETIDPQTTLIQSVYSVGYKFDPYP